MSFKPIILGRTGLKVGRLGIGSSYGVPKEAIEEAYERGVNYFYWGALRRKGMGKAIRNLAKKDREKIVVVLQYFPRVSSLLQWFLERGLKSLKLDYIDVLLLGYFNKRPSQKIIDKTLDLKEKGLIRFLGISSHNRSLFPILEKEKIFDIFHIRYSAAHRGAEKEIFPYLPKENGPGIVVFNATKHGRLLKKRKIPKEEKVPKSSDCYRFCLSHPSVHVCITGPKNSEQMREALLTLDKGPMNPEEHKWMHRVGDFVHG